MVSYHEHLSCHSYFPIHPTLGCSPPFPSAGRWRRQWRRVFQRCRRHAFGKWRQLRVSGQRSVGETKARVVHKCVRGLWHLATGWRTSVHVLRTVSQREYASYSQLALVLTFCEAIEYSTVRIPRTSVATVTPRGFRN